MSMTLQELPQVISQVGFPIFVAVYLLVYIKRETQQTREVLLKLEGTIAKLCYLVNHDKKEG